MTHLVWDWNGTLLDDLELVVAATNVSLATYGGPTVTAVEHRRDFRRPIADYYAFVLGRPISDDEFVELDRVFHDTYREGLSATSLADGARDALSTWAHTQSLLSMWHHRDLVPTVATHNIDEHLLRIDGLRDAVGGGGKAPHLRRHLAALGIAGEDCVLIGDSIDDADAAAEVGAGVVLYTGGFTDEARLRATGLPVASSLVEAVRLASAR